MDGFVVDTTITQKDWDAYVACCSHRARTAVWWAPGATIGLITLAGTLLALWREPGEVLPFVIGVGVVVGALAFGSVLMQKRWRPDAEGSVLGPARITFDAEGMHVDRLHTSGFTRWSAVRDLTVTSDHLFVWIDRVLAHLIPVRDLPAGLSSRDAAARIRAWAGAAVRPALPAPPPERTPASEPALARAPPAVRAELGALARLLTLRRVEPDRIPASDLVIAAVAIFTIALVLVANRWEAGVEARVSLNGVTGLAWYALTVIALTWFVSRLTSPRVPFRAVFLVLLAFVPLAVVAHLAFDRWAAPVVGACGVIAVYAFGLLYLQRGLRTFGAARTAPAVIGAAVAFAAFSAFNAETYVPTYIWYAAPDEEEEERWEATRRGDRLLFEQQSRIDAELARLTARDPAKPNLFFVGFAGYAEQRVFAEEIAFAADVIGDRYGSGTRALQLVNDRRDVESKPLATVSGLRYALAGLAQKMDVNEDILFLVLSSHGDEEPSLSVSNGYLPLEQLNGAALKEALDASGIELRVIVISACHSGAFVQPLKDERTIILTAAAADRTSFGCSDERELTYFGEAFFRDALPFADSLRGAFEQARLAIETREAAEGVSASKPQAHFGAELERRWGALEASAVRQAASEAPRPAADPPSETS